MTLNKITKRIFSIPTVPLHEQFIAKEIYAILSDYPQTKIEIDEYSNLYVSIDSTQNDRSIPLLLLTAHMDHPGFYCDEKGRIFLLGGIDESYLKEAPLTFYREDNGEQVCECKLKGFKIEGNKKSVECKPAPPPNSMGMFNLPPYEIKNGFFFSRACDDLVGVCTLIHLLIQVVSKKLNTKIAVLFSRAEEIGFWGTLAFLKKKTLNSQNTIMVSIETSQARGYCSIDQGPVLRVGDKTRLFDANVVAWLQKAMEEYKGVQSGFVYQKKYMGGGTCETTPFLEFGYAGAALCLALENYHNMGSDGHITMEFVSMKDWEELCSFLEWFVTYPRDIETLAVKRKERMLALQKEAIERLKENRLF
ncbi:M20/M25/M40 family metallo-hydrolase [Candidatus Methylacidiphilum infernorum]|uniref:M20/M25/M40 family metallo-hydrolase n=1 Tax=Candidatus Methylacidiphilum infernorum TaxID=511746 RepID=A0ABX7PW38_9BACT|nr:M20/M25/M40 family metallo-hydrolase [Candidatus Methylacidiphilum infernorum]QSR86888.1 M20/M25/M40 family metallo-hydrolase [Candidatus Methylacidiphilum infernorum]